MNKKMLWLFGPIVLGLLILFIVVRSKQAPTRLEASEAATPARVMTLEMTIYRPQASGFGSVTPGRVWRVIAEVGGEIVELHPQFEVGGFVPEGEVLMRIDADEYQFAVKRAKSVLDQYDARLTELDLDEANLKKTLALEQRTLALMERDYRRNQNLVREGSISELALEQNERDMLRQQLQIESVSHQLVTMPSRRTQLEAQRNDAAVGLADAQRRLSLTEIRTPFACRVAVKDAELGQAVLPGSLVAEGHGMAVAEVEAGLTLEAFNLLRDEQGRISQDLEAEVRLQTGGRTFTWSAEFLRMDAGVDPQTRTVGVIVAVREPYAAGGAPPLVKDLYCEVVIRAPQREALLIPRVALHGEDVYVLDAEDRLARKTVQIRARQGDLVEIGKGLQAGDQVILSDLTPAVTGMLIQPTRADAVEVGGAP